MGGVVMLFATVARSASSTVKGFGRVSRRLMSSNGLKTIALGLAALGLIAIASVGDAELQRICPKYQPQSSCQ